VPYKKSFIGDKAMKNIKPLQGENDISYRITTHELIHGQEMSLIHLSEAEKMLLENIERNLVFSLTDKDARAKLNCLSKIIVIPSILYQYVA